MYNDMRMQALQDFPKHHELVLTVPTEFSDALIPEGVTVRDYDAVCAELQCTGSFLPRWVCNKLMTFRQIVNYNVFVRGEDESTEIFVYQRSKGVGESRLVGKKSFGFGGHIELDDADYLEGIPGVDEASWVLDFQRTLESGFDRETSEEIILMSSDGVEFVPEGTGTVMMVRDDSNDVGRAHLGFSRFYQLDETVELIVADEHLITIGWVPLNEILATLDEYENWSSMIVKFITADITNVRSTL